MRITVKQKSKSIGCRITAEIYEAVKRLARLRGVTPAELLRQLLLQELERLDAIDTSCKTRGWE